MIAVLLTLLWLKNIYPIAQEPLSARTATVANTRVINPAFLSSPVNTYVTHNALHPNSTRITSVSRSALLIAIIYNPTWCLPRPMPNHSSQLLRQKLTSPRLTHAKNRGLCSQWLPGTRWPLQNTMCSNLRTFTANHCHGLRPCHNVNDFITLPSFSLVTQILPSFCYTLHSVLPWSTR